MDPSNRDAWQLAGEYLEVWEGVCLRADFSQPSPAIANSSIYTNQLIDRDSNLTLHIICMYVKSYELKGSVIIGLFAFELCLALIPWILAYEL